MTPAPAPATADSKADLDPRVRRSRQLLHEALDRLLTLRSFENISVGDIAGEASLNRATFYDHYPDKYALLEGLVAARFDELLTARSVIYDGTCPSAIQYITLALCDYLANLPGSGCPHRMAAMEGHFERALVQVVRRLLLTGIRQHPPAAGQSPEMLASVVSGALYGAAREWLRTPDRPPAEVVVGEIYQLVSPLLAPS